MSNVFISIPNSTVKLSSYKHDVESTQRVLDVFGLSVGPPHGLIYLAVYLEDPPRAVDRLEDLDEILEGIDIDKHEGGLADGTYIDGVLKSLEWWIGVSDAILRGPGMESAYGDPYPKQKEKIKSLIFDVLDAYKGALSNTMCFQGPEEDSMTHIELLKRYRRFTKYVCEFAREVWPDVNLDRLFNQA